MFDSFTTSRVYLCTVPFLYFVIVRLVWMMFDYNRILQAFRSRARHSAAVLMVEMGSWRLAMPGRDSAVRQAFVSRRAHGKVVEGRAGVIADGGERSWAF